MGGIFSGAKKPAAPPSKITEHDRAVAVRWVEPVRHVVENCGYLLLIVSFFCCVCRHSFTIQKLKGQRNRLLQYQRKVSPYVL